MVKKMSTVTSILVLSFLLFAVSVYADTAKALLVVDQSGIQEGRTVTVQVVVDHAEDLFGIEFALEYDKQVLELESVSVSEEYDHYASDSQLEAEGALYLPLIRRSVNDTSYKQRTPLADVTFIARKAGATTITLSGVKAVSTEGMTNDYGYDDLKLIPLGAEESITLNVSAAGTEEPPYVDNQASTNLIFGLMDLDKLREAEDPLGAMEQLIKLLSVQGIAISPQIRNELLQWIDELVQRVLTFEAQSSGGAVFMLTSGEVQAALDAVKSLSAAFALHNIDVAVHSNAMAIRIISPGGELVIPLQAVELEAGDGDAFVSVTRISPWKEAMAGAKGGVYRAAADYRFEGTALVFGKREAGSPSGGNAVVLLQYEADLYDTDKLGLYGYNEALSTWEYIRSARHNRLNRSFETKLGAYNRYAILEYAKSYSDIDQVYEQARTAIERLSARHIIDGVSDRLYAPYNKLTRAQFVKLLATTFQWEIAPYSGSFSDVRSDQWHAGYVEAAIRAGAIEGFDGKFEPDSGVTREQMAVMLMRVIGKPDERADDGTQTFADDEEISGWAKDAVYQARALGLVNGDADGKFKPKQLLNRADAAVLFMNVLDRIEAAVKE